MAKTAVINLLDKNGVSYPLNIALGWNQVEAIEKDLGLGFFQSLTQMGFKSAAIYITHGVRGAGETPEQRGVTVARVREKLQEHLDGGGTFTGVVNQLVEAFKSLGLIPKDGDEGRPTE